MLFKNRNTIVLNKKLKLSWKKKKNVKQNQVNIARLLKIKKTYNLKKRTKHFNYFFFLNKLFNSISKYGKKNISINFYLRMLNLIFLSKKRTKHKITNKRRKMYKFNKKKSSIFYSYFMQVAYKLLPCFVYINHYSKGKTVLLPWLRKDKELHKRKLTIIGVLWFKKSYILRKEKTIFLKFFSELECIRSGKCGSIDLKIEYYKNFYQNKRYIKYIRNKRWI